MTTICVGPCAAIQKPPAGPQSTNRHAMNLRIDIIFYDMKKLIALVSILCLASGMAAQEKENKLFPYSYALDDLDNGLRLVTVPTDFPNMIAVYIVVQTGSRNEVEPGKSGYAHLFEHIMI